MKRASFHRDLRRANVMLVRSGVKVLDFGLASSEGEPGLNLQLTTTETSTVMGTVAYMSPEQFEKKVDARGDIFSFGALLYEMLTGRRAFTGNSVSSISYAILRDEPTPASEIIQGVPRELDNIVTRCLQKDPNRRYQHPGDLQNDLRRVKEGLASGESAITEQLQRGQKRHRRLSLVAAVSVASCLAMWWVLGRPQSSQGSREITRLTGDAGISRY